MLLLVLHRRELVDSVDEKMISQYNEIQQREKRVGVSTSDLVVV